MIQHNQYLRSELTSCVIIFSRAHEGERSGEKIRGQVERDKRRQWDNCNGSGGRVKGEE